MKNGLYVPVLGIDPGKTAGGAALLSGDGKSVLRAWAWRERTRKGEKYIELNGGSFTPSCMADVGDVIAGDASAVIGRGVMGGRDSWVLVVEGLFVGQSKKEALTLEWNAGLVAAVPMCFAIGDVIRPTAMQWRPEVVGIPGNTSAKDAAALAVKWVNERFDMGALADNEHACEAVCQAVYGWRYATGRLAA